MGNHEYCSGCGASDFHTGTSCAEAYPEKWAEKEKERKAKQSIVDKETARVDKRVRAVLKGGNKAVVARILATRYQTALLNKKLEALNAEIQKLDNETKVLYEHCPHPKKYIKRGFMYTTCDLCLEMW